MKLYGSYILLNELCQSVKTVQITIYGWSKMAKQGGGLETKSGTLALGLKSAVNLPIPSDDSAPMALQGWFTICTALIYTLSYFAIRCRTLFALTGALYITMCPCKYHYSLNPVLYFLFWPNTALSQPSHWITSMIAKQHKAAMAH